MRGFAAVFRREIAERRLLALVGLLGLVPLALPWFNSSLVPDLGALRGAAAVALANIASAVLALLLGATVLAHELGERRLGFYFNRPLGAGAIWAGKLGAAFASSVAVGLLVLVPTLLADGPSALRSGAVEILFPVPLGGQLLLWLAALLVLILLAHAFSVVIRARSTWLLLDVGGALLTSLVAWGALARLHAAFASRLVVWGELARVHTALASRPLVWAIAGIAIALPLALLAASAAQVALGRTDLRRAHRVLSLTLWGGMLAAALGVAGYSRWLLAATPVDLEAVAAAKVAPRGDWLALAGPAARRGGYTPAFLLDSASGRFLRIGPESLSWLLRPLFSADGRWVAWVQFQTGPGSPLDLLYADLRSPRPAPVRTTISFTRYPELDLSPEGGRIAALSEGRLLVYELATGRLLDSAPFNNPGGRVVLQFTDPRRIRLYWNEFATSGESEPARFAWRTNITEYDLPTRDLYGTGHLEPGLGLSNWAFRPDGDVLMYSVNERGRRFRLVDARSGRPLTEIPAAGSAVFLHDGRVAYAVPAKGGWEVRLLERSGRPGRSGDGSVVVVHIPDKELKELRPGGRPSPDRLARLREGFERLARSDAAPAVAFPFSGEELRLGGEPSPGRLVVATRGSGTPWRVFLLDLASGTSREVAQGLFPVPWYDPEGLTPPHLFGRPGGGLVWLDPETGKRRVVLERGQVQDLR
jgi:hypothetical protein